MLDFTQHTRVLVNVLKLLEIVFHVAHKPMRTFGSARRDLRQIKGKKRKRLDEVLRELIAVFRLHPHGVCVCVLNSVTNWINYYVAWIFISAIHLRDLIFASFGCYYCWAVRPFCISSNITIKIVYRAQSAYIYLNGLFARFSCSGIEP